MSLITPHRLREVLAYDAETGIFRSLRRRGGPIVGSPNRHGYIYISIRPDPHRYQAHRLAWLYVHGEWPPTQLDHRDCNPSNNAIANLRLASNSQQRANSLGIPGKKTPKGVTTHHQTGKFQAQIKVNGKSIYLGLHKTAEAAHAAYLKAAQFHFGEFARAA